MLRNWTQRVLTWLQSEEKRAPRRRRGSGRQFDGNRRGAMIHHLETLEARRLLTSLVAVSVSGGAVSLTDVSTRHATGDFFDVTYSSSQMVLTGHNGTSFQVGNQTLSTYTAAVTGNLSLTMSLGSGGNAVSVTGDGTSNLSSLTVDLGTRRQSNSLLLTNVVAGSITANGSRGGDSVTLNQCKVSGDVSAQLGRPPGDFFSLATTTVAGNVDVSTSQLVVNHSTITGTLSDVQSGRFSSVNSTNSTFTGATDITMGRHGTVNMLTSTGGVSEFKGALTVTGRKHAPTVINQQTNSVTYDVAPTLTNASIQGAAATPVATVPAPTVVSQSVPNSVTPTITGTFNSTATPNLSVTAAGKTYVLGTDAELTSPSSGQWSLNLGSNVPLTTLKVTATSSDNQGHTATSSGTIATDQAAIDAYVAANGLTATKTADGLNYVITTNGTGAIPTAGQSVSVNYTGRIVNPDGTLGTEFDSNVDPQFKHVQPFAFNLGLGTVIAGWDEAFALLRVGTVAKLLIPSELAYKAAGSPPKIPPNSVLEFDVTLVSAT